MPYKRRTSKGHDVKIAAEAISLFKRGRELQRAGPARRREFLDCCAELHRVLGLKVWSETPLCAIGEAPPARMDSERERDDWEAARELRLRLVEAARAQEGAAVT
jgi:hypothetical protein